MAEEGGNGYVSAGIFSLVSPDKARVTTKTRGVMSAVGEIIAHDVSFDPIVNQLQLNPCPQNFAQSIEKRTKSD